MIVYKLSLGDDPGGNPIIFAENDTKHILAELENGEIGDSIFIEKAEMTEKDFKNLKEHPGW